MDKIEFGNNRWNDEKIIEKLILQGSQLAPVLSWMLVRANAAVCAAVADSPFRSLPVLLREALRALPLPAGARSLALWWLRRRIQRRAGFSIGSVVPEDAGPDFRAPLFVIHAQSDDLIAPEHSRRLLARYGGDSKQIRIVAGNHESRRPTGVMVEAMEFVARAFGVGIQAHGVRQRIAAVAQHFRACEGQMKMVPANVMGK
jgi:hypothetical protein